MTYTVDIPSEKNTDGVSEDQRDVDHSEEPVTDQQQYTVTDTIEEEKEENPVSFSFWA